MVSGYSDLRTARLLGRIEQTKLFWCSIFAHDLKNLEHWVFARSAVFTTFSEMEMKLRGNFDSGGFFDHVLSGNFSFVRTPKLLKTVFPAALPTQTANIPIRLGMHQYLVDIIDINAFGGAILINRLRTGAFLKKDGQVRQPKTMTE